MKFLSAFFSRISSRIWKSDPETQIAQKLYWEIVAVSRNPIIYKEFNIPDTLDGRFDSLLLHLFLVINRLQILSKHKLSDILLNIFTKDMDRSLRETGVGDPSITRKMRKVGEAYMGRMSAYGVALSTTDALYKALHKNIYRNNEDVTAKHITLLTQYVMGYKVVLGKFTPDQPLPQASTNIKATL
ncbi:MAG: cytochrome b pre-mRNA-processing protein 3 [Alphaproteobacteria bacterium]|jgi:cytochrome b pre-mRNA-processing protein 3